MGALFDGFADQTPHEDTLKLCDTEIFAKFSDGMMRYCQINDIAVVKHSANQGTTNRFNR